MLDNTYTDPMMSLLEGPFDWGSSKPKVVAPSVDISHAKDVTPDPHKEGINAMVEAYNAGDVRQQMRFIEILLTHEMPKVQAVMQKVKGL